jgi:hypothetical protein
MQIHNALLYKYKYIWGYIYITTYIYKYMILLRLEAVQLFTTFTTPIIIDFITQ